jgi:hypothetical protein
MSSDKRALDKFGTILMEKVRDESIQQWEDTLEGRVKAPALLKLNSAVSQFTPEQKEFLRAVISKVVDTTLHHLLWTLEQEEDVKVSVGIDAGVTSDIAKASDGLSGELYSDEGWIRRFSKERYEPIL